MFTALGAGDDFAVSLPFGQRPWEWPGAAAAPCTTSCPVLFLLPDEA